MKGISSSHQSRASLLELWTIGKHYHYGNCLTITDTRPCATERLLSLEGLAYWVYKVCDRALTPRELVKAARTQLGIDISWDDVQPIVAQLQERKILVDLNGRLLSLAVKDPCLPLPMPLESLGGYVDIDGFCRINRKRHTILETWGFSEALTK